MFAGIVYPNPFENDPILFSPCCAPVLCGLGCGTSGHPAGYFPPWSGRTPLLPTGLFTCAWTSLPGSGGKACSLSGTGCSGTCVSARRCSAKGSMRAWSCRSLSAGRGRCEEPEVVSSTDERCAAEVLRVLASAPLWTPGRLEKVAVRTKLVMPVNIRLEVPTAADSPAAGLSDGIPLEEGCGRGNGTDAAISGRGSAKFPQMGDGEPEISPGGARG